MFRSGTVRPGLCYNPGPGTVPRNDTDAVEIERGWIPRVRSSQACLSSRVRSPLVPSHKCGCPPFL